MRAFVTGTDTGVGKTYVVALLTRALRRAGLDTLALKPICSGDRTDAEILRAASDDEASLDEVNPLWFSAPIAPLLAARAEGREVAIPALAEWFGRVSAGRKSVLVEGAGGWLAPVTSGGTVSTLCCALGLPVILVAANRIGCVNHVLLTLESIRAHGQTCQGIILNSLPGASDQAMSTNRSLLEEFTDVPILFEISARQSEIPLALV